MQRHKALQNIQQANLSEEQEFYPLCNTKVVTECQTWVAKYRDKLQIESDFERKEDFFE